MSPVSVNRTPLPHSAAAPGASMRVQMRDTRRGSPDGIRSVTYTEGEVVDLPVDLGTVFVREGWAVAVEAPPAPAPSPAAAAAPPKAVAVVTPGENKLVTPDETKEDIPASTDEVAADAMLLEYSPEDAKELVATLTDPAELRALRAGEQQNEEFPGGRALVLAAIDERLSALAAQG